MIPTTIIEVFLFGFLALNMDFLVDNNMIRTIFCFLLALVMMVLVESLPFSAFAIKQCVGKDQAKYGIITQIGVILSQFLASELFIPLNSVKFCKKYFRMENEEVVLTQNTMMIVFLVLTLMSLAAYALIKEKPEEELKEYVSVYRCVKN